MIKELVYLATPYSGSDEEMDFRAIIVNSIAKDLANEGVMVYSPVSSWHEIASKYKMPRNYEFWKDMCETFVSKCDKVIVVILPGWHDSVGVRGEVEFARDNNIKVEYLDPTPYIAHLGMELL